MSYTEDNVKMIDRLTQAVEVERISNGMSDFKAALIVCDELYEICKYHEGAEFEEGSFMHINKVAIIRSLEEESLTRAFIPL